MCSLLKKSGKSLLFSGPCLCSDATLHKMEQKKEGKKVEEMNGNEITKKHFLNDERYFEILRNDNSYRNHN